MVQGAHRHSLAVRHESVSSYYRRVPFSGCRSQRIVAPHHHRTVHQLGGRCNDALELCRIMVYVAHAIQQACASCTGTTSLTTMFLLKMVSLTSITTRLIRCATHPRFSFSLVRISLSLALLPAPGMPGRKRGPSGRR